jgi:hypothetical protein
MSFLDELEGEGIKYFEATEWIEHLGFSEDLKKGRVINQRFFESGRSKSFVVSLEEKRQWAWVFTEGYLAANAVGLSNKEQLSTMTEIHYKKIKKSLQVYVRG